MRRSRRRRVEGEVELNLTAMLDMAFQLLAFFIVTFDPGKPEGEILLRMPPARSVVAGPTKLAATAEELDSLADLRTLSIEVLPGAQGEIAAMELNGQLVGGLNRLDERLREVFAQPAAPFDQVLIQAGSGLRYDALMHVVEVCTRQTLPGGQPLTKLSFTEVSDRVP